MDDRERNGKASVADGREAPNPAPRTRPAGVFRKMVMVALASLPVSGCGAARCPAPQGDESVVRGTVHRGAANGDAGTTDVEPEPVPAPAYAVPSPDPTPMPMYGVEPYPEPDPGPATDYGVPDPDPGPVEEYGLPFNDEPDPVVLYKGPMPPRA